MNARMIHALQAARDLLRSGRAHDALEALDEVLREHKVMPAPLQVQEAPLQVPLWMRRS